MDIQLHKTLKTLDGKDMYVQGEKATVGTVAQHVLLHSSAKNYERKISLAKRLMTEEGEVSLKAEDISLIKETAKEMQFTAELIYQFEQAIDPVEESEE